MKEHIKVSEQLQKFGSVHSGGVQYAQFEINKILDLIDKIKLLEQLVEEQENSLQQNLPADEHILLPKEVVRFHVIEGNSLVAAWRKYLGLSQTDIANRMGVSQPTYAKFEKANDMKLTTLKRISDAMGIHYSKLCD